jgi:UDP-N-acetylmuramoylalanine--D-glutamate ligase
MDFGTRTVLVCGAGVAGAPAARALLELGAEVVLTDRRETPQVAELVRSGARFATDLDDVPVGVDLVVTSPGFAPTHPLLMQAAAKGIAVLGEVEFAWQLRGPGAAPWLAVTGTNGKTTTVRMLESILRAAGLRAIAVGNVGTSIIDAVRAEPGYDVLAVELSSFQLHWSHSLHPRAGALLNLAPDHIDWHGSFESYAEAKTAIWRAEVAIAVADDPEVAARFARLDRLAEGLAPRRVEVTAGRPGPGQFGCRNGQLVDRTFDADGLELVPAEQIRPVGQHNLINALTAAALARALGPEVDAEAVRTGLQNFVPDPHRNQLIATVSGVRYVDDSKATNAHAAAAAMSAYPRIVWIAGGQLKQAPVDDLVATYADRLSAVVLLGVDRDEISAALARHAPDVPVIEVARTDDRAMTEVVQAAAGLARPGDTVLLAPAAASYDMFSGYSARGDAFVAAVGALEPS